MLRTQEDQDQEDFLGDLTLHEELPCTSANIVEAHRDLQPGEETVLGMLVKC